MGRLEQMEARKGSIYSLKLALWILLGASIFAYGYTFISGFSGSIYSGIISIIINFFIFLVIYLCCKKFKKDFYDPAMSVKKSLDHFHVFMDEYDESKYDTALAYIKENRDNIFEDKYLTDCMKEYLDEIDMLNVEDAEGYRCDISEYIHYEDVLAYVHKNVAENIAASMTGLGILGTFIGLAFGLQSFNASSAQTMTDSIKPLIDGIKAAFYTSIYGVTVSLVMNHIIKKEMADVDKSLDGFYETFYQKVLTYPEHELEKRGFDLQEEQKETLSKFAEDISVAFSKELKGIIDPAFDKFNSTIDLFSKNVAENQVVGLERIVDSFVGQMNTKLQGQFDNLADTIESMCEWQKQSAESLDKVLKDIEESAYDINDMNIRCNETIDHFDEYLGKLITQDEKLNEQNEMLKGYLNDIKNSFEKIDERIDKAFESIDARFGESLTQEKDLIESNKELTQQITDNLDELRSLNDETNESVESMLDGIKAVMEEYLDTAKKETSAIENSIEVLDKKLQLDSNSLASAVEAFNQSVDTSIQRTFEEFDKEMAGVVSYFAGAASEITSNTENLPKLVNEIFDELAGQTKEYTDNIAGLNVEVKKMIEGVTEKINSINDSEKEALEGIELKKNEISELMTQQMEDEMSNLRKFYSDAAQEMTAHTEKMPAMFSNVFEQVDLQTRKYSEKVDSLHQGVNQAIEGLNNVTDEINNYRVESLANIDAKRQELAAMLESSEVAE